MMVIVVAFFVGLAVIWLGMLLLAVAYHLWPIVVLLVLLLAYREHHRQERWKREMGC